MGVLAETARAQLQRAKALGKSLDERLKAKTKAAADFTLDEDFRRDFAAVTLAIQHAGKSLQQALEAQRKANAGMTDAQLEAQWHAEMVRGATTIPDKLWEQMLDARAKRAVSKGTT